MADILMLGDFQFADLEIPEEIPMFGEQRLAIKKLVGGARVIDALGNDPAPVEWSGLLVGKDALTRANRLEAMKAAGLPVTLTWNKISLKVVICEFKARFRFGEIPYTIICEVLPPAPTAAKATPKPSATALIKSDMANASTLAAQVNNPAVSTAVGNLNTAVSNVQSFANASQSTINTVLQPLNAAKSAVSSVIGTVDGALGGVTSLAGVLPGTPLAANLTKLSAQLNGALQMPALLQLQGTLGRIGTNLAQVNSSVRTVVTSGGNLYDLAAKHYKDATGWTAIASANKVKDPQLTGNQTVAIPPLNNNTGGVLNA